MAKITINSITSGFASNTLLNTNFSALTSELNNKVLYRNNPVGEPNSMMNDLDMNSNDILNINDVYADNVILNGVAIAASAVALPIASDTILGVSELSTDAEAQAKSGVTVITASNLAALNATDTMSGLVEKATTAEAQAATVDKFPDAAGVKSYVDQFGIGVDNLNPVADLNTITKSGICRANNTTANIPAGGMDYTAVLNSVRNSGEMTQLATNVTGTPRMSVRSKVSGIWSAWAYFNPTIGTVSQSGGIPTGAIIESGSNANGDYTKFADGTMICYGNNSLGSVAITTATGSSFYSAVSNTLTFAAVFSSTPAVTVSIYSGSDTASVSRVSTNTSTASLWFTRPTSVTSILVVGYVAIGRWY